MRWQEGGESENVEDRRGLPVGTALGGAGTIIVIVLGLLLGVDPRALMQQLQNQAPPAAPAHRQDSPEDARKVSFVKHVLFQTEQVWTDLFQTQVPRHPVYVKPKLVLFTGRVQSACGFAESATGPFYCPGDQKVYIDLEFYDELKNRFHAGGDFANAYVVAHEVGHHVQNLLNISPESEREKNPRLRNDTANQLSVRLELQADFLAGVWAHYADQSGIFWNKATWRRRLRPPRRLGTTACKSRRKATLYRRSSPTADRISGSIGSPRASIAASWWKPINSSRCRTTHCELANYSLRKRPLRGIISYIASWHEGRGGKSMKRRAFTLVELLVVIAIIGILVGLLVPAVQSAREAGRRTQCSNNLNQLTKAAIQHETAHQYYPTGGWTGAWSGDPNFGTGQRQPGGWTYNILPFIEQQPLHDLGLTSNGAKAGPNVLGQAANTPLALFYCPTRRVASVYPIAAATCNSPGITTAAKTDYAASAGTNQSTGWTTAPTSGDPAAVARSLNGQFPDMSNISNGGFNGVIYTLSTTTHADIQNGSSNTLFFGEKYLDPLAYLSGSDPADNKPIFAGFANDWERFAANGPHHDTRGSPDPVSFGSAHVDGLNVFTCDGSGHWMSYSVDPLTFAMLCSRQNTNPIDASKLKW